MATAAPRDYQSKHVPFAFRYGTQTYKLPTNLTIEQGDALRTLDDATSADEWRVTLKPVIGAAMTEALVAKIALSDLTAVVTDWMSAIAGGRGNSSGSSD